MCGSVHSHSHTSRPSHLIQGPQVYRHQVGRAIITALSDGTIQLDPTKVLHGISSTDIKQYLEDSFLTADVETSINVYLIELDNRRMLVDTGTGDWFGPGLGGRMLDNLRAAGVEPEQITDILVTHTHADHTGGMVVGGQRQFVNAQVHVGQPDVDFFLDPQQKGKLVYSPEDMPEIFEQILGTMGPYAEAGQLRPFDSPVEIMPGLTAALHPGHTPGSAAFTLVSEGQTIVFIGDMVHVEAIQFRSPEAYIDYDVDGRQAAITREKAFRDLAQRRVLVAAPHLRYPGIGHIRTESKGYTWVPEVFGDRRVGE